ncbi:MAG: hypothetical protein ACK46I_13485, partial [Phycisphaerae bacterium]
MQDGQAQRDVQLGDHSASDPASVLTQHMEVKSQAISSRASGLQPSAAFLARVPHAFARQHLLLSLGVQGERELLAVTRSTSPAAV